MEQENLWTPFISWAWKEVAQYVFVSFFIILAVLVKILYHSNKWLMNNLPESCALIILGIMAGVVFVLPSYQNILPELTPDLFNFILLPPIVLDSSYDLDDPAFYTNLGTILTFAVIGTMLNIAMVAGLMSLAMSIGVVNVKILPVELFVFAVIVAAVDPVAVLSVFNELKVNKALYFIVFGESLLNDAVVIVAYERVLEFAKMPIVRVNNVIIMFTSFAIAAIFGLLVGIFFGLCTASLVLFTKYKRLRATEPLILLFMAYSSYLIAYLFGFSGIFSITACGLVQAEFAIPNISPKSKIILEYIIKITSSTGETIIFLLLGVVLTKIDYEWSSSFVIFSSVFIIIARFATVFLLSYAANNFFQRIRIVNFEEQVLIAYGGLRGAIAFSLVTLLGRSEASLGEPVVKQHKLFTTTILFIVLFTVLVLGSTTKPVVKMLRVRIETQTGMRTFYALNSKVANKVMQGIEVIVGQESTVFLAKKAHYFSQRIKKKIFSDLDESHRTLTIDNSPRKRTLNALRSPTAEIVFKDAFPDLNKRITVREALDSDGNLVFPKLSDLPSENYRNVMIHGVSRKFAVPKECTTLVKLHNVSSIQNLEPTKSSFSHSSEASSFSGS